MCLTITKQNKCHKKIKYYAKFSFYSPKLNMMNSMPISALFICILYIVYSINFLAKSPKMFRVSVLQAGGRDNSSGYDSTDEEVGNRHGYHQLFFNLTSKPPFYTKRTYSCCSSIIGLFSNSFFFFVG